MVVAIVGILVYTQLTIFVIPPIGAVPEGKTLVIARMTNTRFIDSADAICERIQNGVSLLCRGMVLGTILSKTVVLLRLPYSDTLYMVSTGGTRYEK